MTDAELLKEQQRIRNNMRGRERRIERKYGVSPEAWETCFNMQGRKCACCESMSPRSNKGWHVDHDHENGLVRGILCSHCNVAAAMVEDDANRAEQLARYLRRTARWHERCADKEHLYPYARVV